MPGAERRARLRAARLYLICDSTPGARPLREVLEPALAGGVDIFQLRDKRLDERELRACAVQARAVCQAAGALFIVNDRPALARDVHADGLHVGQQDATLAAARAIVGDELLLGRSTHSPPQVDAADGADYIGVGPVHATPTKPGRPPVGVELVRHAAAHAGLPFFAIGGIDAGNVGAVIEAGARRVAVVRAIAEAPDPGAAARALREAIERVPLETGIAAD